MVPACRFCDIGIGSTFRYTQHLDRPGGRRVIFDGDVEIVALDTSSIKWRVTDRFQDRTVTCVVESSGNGSVVSQTTEAAFRRPPGVARLAYAVRGS